MFGYLIIIFVLCNVTFGFSNTTLENTGNDLWYGLIQDCEKPTSACIKNTIHDYLKNTLDYPDDIQFTSFLRFSKNSRNYQGAVIETGNSTEDEPEEDETPLQEISRSLSDNTKKFFMTHDLEVALPDSLFLGSSLKVSPLSVDSNGTMVKLELVPREIDETVGNGRILLKKFNKPEEEEEENGLLSGIGNFFLWSNVGKVVWSILKFIGKLIGKFISDRLIYALLAIVLVIKLLAVKFLFVLPSLVGVVAAKKLIVKVLLFLFPFLQHLFKLCAVTPYGAKHHIHKHQIAHIHQVAPGYHSHQMHHHEGPPGHHHFAHKDDTGQGGDPVPAGTAYEKDVYKEPPPEENDLGFWGSLGFTQSKPKEEEKKELSPIEIENMVLKAEKEALIKSRLQKEQQRIHEENLRLQEQLNNALKIHQKLKHHSVLVAHKMKPPKHKHHHFLPPPPRGSGLLPPPPAPHQHYGASHFGKPTNYFAEPPLQYDIPPPIEDSKLQIPQPGPFAEPPSNFVENQHHVEAVPSGMIGEGLPANTVDAVQSYLTQKNTQKTQVYPVYQQNHLEPENHATSQNFVTPQYVTVQSIQSGTSVLPTPQHHVPSQTKVMSNRKSDSSSQEEQFYKAAQITYDKFYSPILEKIDSVLNELEFTEEPCRERLICSMYKQPEKFSPHSNLVSAELSRDSEELQKPASTNSAVIRFYKYVQAARDGQDQRDCLRLYPACAINTEG